MLNVGLDHVINADPVSRGASPMKARFQDRSNEVSINPNRFVAQQTQVDYKYNEKNLKRQTEIELLKQELMREFDSIDRNNDNMLSIDELEAMFREKVPDIDLSEVDKLFRELDQDGSNYIDKQEFVNFFFEERTKLEDEIQILEKELIDEQKDLKAIKE